MKKFLIINMSIILISTGLINIIDFSSTTNSNLNENLEKASTKNIDLEYIYDSMINDDVPVQYEISFSYVDILKSYYNDVIDYYDSLPIEIEAMTFEDFYDEFYSQDEFSISEYSEILMNFINQEEMFFVESRSSSSRE